MIQNEDIALNSLKITSNIDSYDNYSGSLILRGGLGCKKTIHTKNLCSDKISVKELCVDYVDCLNVDKLKCRNLNCDFAEINELHLEEASFNKLLPNTNCNNIGDEYNRVNLYSNDLDNYNSNIENLNTKNADIDHLNVKNDINFDNNKPKIVMSHNASGKSSCGKSICLAIYLAQCGFYVASKMKFKPYSKLLTRIQSDDNLVTGLSSFDRELTDLNFILKQIDSNTFLFGDEIAKGSFIFFNVSLIFKYNSSVIKSDIFS